MAGSKEIGVIDRLWPLKESEAQKPISAERVRAIMDRYKLKKHA